MQLLSMHVDGYSSLSASDMYVPAPFPNQLPAWV